MEAKQRRHCEFINAVKEGNLSTVCSFLRMGIGVDASINGGQTALHKVSVALTTLVLKMCFDLNVF